MPRRACSSPRLASATRSRSPAWKGGNCCQVSNTFLCSRVVSCCCSFGLRHPLALPACGAKRAALPVVATPAAQVAMAAAAWPLQLARARRPAVQGVHQRYDLLSRWHQHCWSGGRFTAFSNLLWRGCKVLRLQARVQTKCTHHNGVLPGLHLWTSAARQLLANEKQQQVPLTTMACSRAFISATSAALTGAVSKPGRTSTWGDKVGLDGINEQ